MVLPVTVMTSPSISFSSSSIFINGKVPPIFTNSHITKRPDGFKSAKTGTFRPTFVKSSIVNFTPAVCAIATKCRTAFVDPPNAVIKAMEFKNDSRHKISLGRIPRCNKCNTATPASKQSRSLSSLTAACAELFGKERPNASIALAIVLAVYMPPHEPAPGIDTSSICCNSASLIVPAA